MDIHFQYPLTDGRQQTAVFIGSGEGIHVTRAQPLTPGQVTKKTQLERFLVDLDAQQHGPA